MHKNKLGVSCAKLSSSWGHLTWKVMRGKQIYTNVNKYLRKLETSARTNGIPLYIGLKVSITFLVGEFNHFQFP